MQNVNISLEIDREYLAELRVRLQMSDAEIVREAFTILDWASKEVEAGRIICSALPDGGQVRIPTIELLEALRDHSRDNVGVTPIDV
jgi:hypothetical protein